MSVEMHRLLIRQLNKIGLDLDTAPTQEQLKN